MLQQYVRGSREAVSETFLFKGVKTISLVEASGFLASSGSTSALSSLSIHV
uniref:Uncharacterized protein n=1 Tax=Arundo donax TaxID=35708 RepID=A0A0A8ZP07_ARUDO